MLTSGRTANNAKIRSLLTFLLIGYIRKKINVYSTSDPFSVDVDDV